MSQKVLYSKLFIPPKFLEMPAVSLEILPEGISYLLTKNTSFGLVPDILGFIPLPPGIVSHGEIVKKDPVIKVLQDIRKKTRVDFVRFSIPEEKTYIFKTHLPNLKSQEIRDVIDFKIEENVPLSVKEAVFDYDVIPNSPQGQGLDVVVSVAPLETVQELQNIFNTANLTPIFFSPEANNVAKSVVKDGNEQVLVIVNIREAEIILSLVISGVVCQTSSLNFGSSVFTDLLAKYFKISKEEVLKVRKEKLYNKNSLNVEIFSYFINTISALKDEIYKFVSYCNEREDVVGRVDRIILCGRDSMIVGLDKYLSSNLNIDVSVANVWVNCFSLDNYTPEISQSDSLNYATLIGLSLY